MQKIARWPKERLPSDRAARCRLAWRQAGVLRVRVNVSEMTHGSRDPRLVILVAQSRYLWPSLRRELAESGSKKRSAKSVRPARAGGALAARGALAAVAIWQLADAPVAGDSPVAGRSRWAHI